MPDKILKMVDIVAKAGIAFLGIWAVVSAVVADVATDARVARFGLAAACVSYFLRGKYKPGLIIAPFVCILVATLISIYK